jgi:hypothetical protein
MAEVFASSQRRTASSDTTGSGLGDEITQNNFKSFSHNFALDCQRRKFAPENRSGLITSAFGAAILTQQYFLSGLLEVNANIH